MLGMSEPYDTAPFFWSNHYDVGIGYVGHAEKWDSVRIAGDVAAGNCLVGFRSGEKTLAVASVNRDKPSLEAEVLMEKADWAGIDALFDREEAVQ
jgi:hypothetical protein